jgi:hypothetical protein
MMNLQGREAFLEYMTNGVLGRFSPTQTNQEALDICESMHEGNWMKREGIYYSPIGQEGFSYGRLYICAEPSEDYWDRTANRMGVDFWKPQRTSLLSEIPWYSELEKMQRSEVYALLREMGVAFMERVKHYEDEPPLCEQISIGQRPMTLLTFYGQPEIPYDILWFKDGLDESKSPYRIELRAPIL